MLQLSALRSFVVGRMQRQNRAAQRRILCVRGLTV
jgi:hypothetical protein